MWDITGIILVAQCSFLPLIPSLLKARHVVRLPRGRSFMCEARVPRPSFRWNFPPFLIFSLGAAAASFSFVLLATSSWWGWPFLISLARATYVCTYLPTFPDHSNEQKFGNGQNEINLRGRVIFGRLRQKRHHVCRVTRQPCFFLSFPSSPFLLPKYLNSNWTTGWPALWIHRMDSQIETTGQVASLDRLGRRFSEAGKKSKPDERHGNSNLRTSHHRSS
jgi:hypothetical protein